MAARMYLLLLGAVGWASVCEADRIVIDSMVDSALPAINAHLKNLGRSNVTLPDLYLPTAPFFIGVTLGDLSTLVRSGTAEMWQVGDSSIAAQVPVSLNDARLHVDSCTFMNGEPFTLSVGRSSLEAGFTITSDSVSCSTLWNYFNLTLFDSLTVHSDDPKYDGKPLPQQVVSLIVPHYNKYLNTPEFIRQVSKDLDLCDPTLGTIS